MKHYFRGVAEKGLFGGCVKLTENHGPLQWQKIELPTGIIPGGNIESVLGLTLSGEYEVDERNGAHFPIVSSLNPLPDITPSGVR